MEAREATREAARTSTDTSSVCASGSGTAAAAHGKPLECRHGPDRRAALDPPCEPLHQLLAKEKTACEDERGPRYCATRRPQRLVSTIRLDELDARCDGFGLTLTFS